MKIVLSGNIDHIIFGIFDELLSTQNENVTRFARNVECDFLYDFQVLFRYRE